MKYLRMLLLVVSVMLAANGCRPAAHDSDPPSAPPEVKVIRPEAGGVARTITLPGDLVGYYETALYAKVTGYLKAIYVDKGDYVKAGQVLAIIEVPELDQQLARARANLQIQRLTYQRLESVWKSDPRLLARQDVDIAYGKYQEAKAGADQLDAMMSYTQITAPFAGVITQRFVDPGALIHAGGQHGSGQSAATAPVVSLARLDKLRVYLYVPQEEVDFVHDGMPATLRVQGFDGVRFRGTVARYAHALDLSTRTMLTEVDVENPERKLYPGMYANVTLTLQRDQDALRLPDSALSLSAPSSVLVVRGGRLAAVPVRTGINNGRYVTITSGLSRDDLVVQTFSSALQPGERVKFEMATAQPIFTATE